ncbi:adenosylcobinamide-GDP ribazoletransferase [Sphingomonas xinjiangensis]|uniref:Adenosylcobinamide-GDP ribazoletransferase n=1 Tax=Sphingomonas xinjiangensis TaxID=643568 RepID=A0A840YC57_9SPHN|nr:adenosylcobinamide-GDP ribazoletransferase [Sphingomonas xinjiangensis]MBB5710947.1 adenosylcobinamide-GDP ribazoletransferase [Sphingomonas xinjiangensis]
MKSLIVALSFLTRLPMPRVEADAGDFADAIRWYPAVGLALGAIVALAVWAGSWIDPWIGALAGLIAWVAVTGALHLDGLGDLADGLGAAHGDRGRMMSVMTDPHIGSFGVVAIIVQLLAKLVLLHAGIHWTALVLIPFAARIGPLFWARWLPPLKPGLGASVASAVRLRDLAGWTAMWAAACLLFPPLMVAPVTLLGWAWWLKARIGGISGDSHGAGIEWCETALLFVSIAASRL